MSHARPHHDVIHQSRTRNQSHTHSPSHTHTITQTLLRAQLPSLPCRVHLVAFDWRLVGSLVAVITTTTTTVFLSRPETSSHWFDGCDVIVIGRGEPLAEVWTGVASRTGPVGRTGW